MERSEQINDLAAALAAAQGNIRNAVKDSANPFFKSSYADLASVRDAVRAPFAANGLAVIQLPTAEGSRVTVKTMLTHSSGQWIAADLTVTAKDDGPQAIGSAITYARRYGLQSMAGVAPDDDDGNAATHSQHPQQRQDNRPKHTPAQQEVVDRKLSEIKQRPEAPAAAPLPNRLMPLDEFRNAKTAQRIDAFAAIRAVLGDEQYFRILGVMGVERADQFANLGAAVKAYTEMLESYNFATAARTVA